MIILKWAKNQGSHGYSHGEKILVINSNIILLIVTLTKDITLKNLIK